MHQLALEDTSAVILFPCRLQLGSILYSLNSPHPTSSSTRTRMRTPPTTITLVIRSYALCACALSQSSYNPFFPRLYFLPGRIVFHVSSSSAQRRGVLQKVTRRKRICEWTPWCVPAHRSEGGGDLCRCTPAPPRAPLSFASPHISRHHLFLPRSPCLSLQMNGGLKISVLSPCRGRTKSSSFLCLSQPESTSLLFDDPVWFLCVCVCARFCGPGSSLPSVFQPGSAKSMAAELDKIRNGTNCSRSLHRISQQYQEYSALKKIF